MKSALLCLAAIACAHRSSARLEESIAQKFDQVKQEEKHQAAREETHAAPVDTVTEEDFTETIPSPVPGLAPTVRRGHRRSATHAGPVETKKIAQADEHATTRTQGVATVKKSGATETETKPAGWGWLIGWVVRLLVFGAAALAVWKLTPWGRALAWWRKRSEAVDEGQK